MVSSMKIAKCCGTCGCCQEESDGFHEGTTGWTCNLTYFFYGKNTWTNEPHIGFKEIENPFEVKDCYQKYIHYGSGSNCKNCYLRRDCKSFHKDSSPTHFCGKWKQGLPCE